MPNVPAWVSNGVVISDSNGSVRFRPKCPFCGEVEIFSERMIYVAPHIGARSSGGTLKCLKCGKQSTTTAGR